MRGAENISDDYEALVNVEQVTALPAVPQTERALLGTLFRNSDLLDAISSVVLPTDFAEEIHGALYDLMLKRRADGVGTDVTVITAALRNFDLGGITVGVYLSGLLDASGPGRNAVDYATQIREAADTRTAILSLEATAKALRSGAVQDPAPAVSGLMDTLDPIATRKASAHHKGQFADEAAGAFFEALLQTRAGNGPPRVPFGIPELDEITNGMKPGELIIGAGRPGMGKTAVALHVAIEAARHCYGVGMFSLEMATPLLMARAFSAAAYDNRAGDPIPYNEIVRGTDLSIHQCRRLERARDYLSSLPLHIEQQPALTLGQIAARSRSLVKKFEKRGQKLGLIIVDYLQLVQASKRYAGNRVHEVSEISAGLKQLARDLNVPVLALAQLNRETERRENPHPKLSDLRDSGSIEQDADMVLGFFRESYYLQQIPEEDLTDDQHARMMRVENELQILLMKQRMGATGIVTVHCEIESNHIEPRRRIARANDDLRDA